MGRAWVAAKDAATAPGWGDVKVAVEWAMCWVGEMAKVLVTVRGASRAPKMARMSGLGKDLKSAAVKVEAMDAL